MKLTMRKDDLGHDHNWITAWNRQGKLVGYLIVDVEPHGLEIMSISVAAEMQRQGIGSKLIAYARKISDDAPIFPGRCSDRFALLWQRLRQDGDGENEGPTDGEIENETLAEMQGMAEWLNSVAAA